MSTIRDIINYLEEIAPLGLQESYDNAGLIVGSPQQETNTVLITLDVTEAVVDEAIEKGAQLIVAHHPLIFSGLKKITGKNEVERTLVKAIKNDVAIYASHTNLDSVPGGVNAKICEKLALQDCSVLKESDNLLRKLVTFIPVSHLDRVQTAVFEAGAGVIGNYDSCGYTVEGTGSFRANSGSNPFVGEQGKLHREQEIRFETVFPVFKEGRVIRALIEAHPYEEVAYDVYQLQNRHPQIGMGMIGQLAESMNEIDFLNKLKDVFGAEVIKHTRLRNKPVKKVAVCGGSGSFLLSKAISAGADIFVTGDFKYHQFFDAEGKIVIADIGHYESEQFTKELFYELLTKKFPKFAVHLSEARTNPVFYF